MVNEGQLVEGAYFMEANSSMYLGEWDGSRRCGLGAEFSVDETVYEGEWADDKRHGMGTLYSADGNSIVYGKFENDILVHEHHRWAWTAALTSGQEVEIPPLTAAWKTSCLSLLQRGSLSQPWRRREELRALRKALDNLRLELLELEAKVSECLSGEREQCTFPWCGRFCMLPL